MIAAAILALVCVPIDPAPVQTVQNVQEFLAGLDEARAFMDKGEWSKGEARLRELIAVHEKRAYVWLHLPELRDSLEACVFWQRYQEPNPKTLVSGELQSFSKNGGNLKIRYTPQTLDDFQVVSKPFRPVVHLHPAAFDGPCSFEIKGSEYKGAPAVLCWFEGGGSKRVEFGSAPLSRAYGGSSVLARIFSLDRERWDEEHSGISPCELGKPYVLRVKVEDTQVTATYNGKPVLAGKKDSGVFGQFAFVENGAYDEITIQGRVQASWMRGLIDAHLQAEWQRCAAEFTHSAVWPEWLKLAHCGAFDAPEFGPDDLPSEPSAELKPKIAELFAAKPDQLVREFGKLRMLDSAQICDDLRAWLIAVVDSRLNRFSAAVAACEQVSALAPDFHPARVLHARMLEFTRHPEAALGAYRELALADPGDTRAACNCAKFEFLLGRYAELDALLRDQVDHARYSDELDQINSLLTRARNGPGWRSPIEFKTEHYVITSDIDRKTCVEAGEVLENSLGRYIARMRPLPKDKPEPFRVYLFGGFAGYSRYVQDALSARAENTAGLYDPRLKQLLIWNLPDHQQMLQTVRHEGLHQYVDRWLDDPPRWLNEGLAEYYENADFTLGPSNEIRIHPEHLRVIRAHDDKLIPLSAFIKYDPAHFYAAAELDYAEAWALVHFLLNSTPAHRKIFDALLDALQRGDENDDALEHAFLGADFAKLQTEFDAYVAAMQN